MRIRSGSPDVQLKYKCESFASFIFCLCRQIQRTIPDLNNSAKMAALVGIRPLVLEHGSGAPDPEPKEGATKVKIESSKSVVTVDEVQISEDTVQEDTSQEDQHAAHNVLGVISRYLIDSNDPKLDLASHYKDTLMPLLTHMVQSKSCIQLVLPAFPFKSPNSRDKVLGVLPDKAEEVSIALLQGMCDAIKDVYEPGAQLTIVSDGIVYNGMGSSYDEC